MINETIQWLVIVSLGILIFGLLHQVAGSMPRRTHTTSGPQLGQRAPKDLLSRIGRAFPEGKLRETLLVAFVTESCTGCQHLLAELTSANGELSRPVVLVAKRASPQFRQALNEAGHPVIHDDDGTLWDLCRVTNTPLVVELSSAGRVLGKEVTAHVDAVGQST